MNRIEAREFYPILQAFAEGKVIETRTDPNVVGKGLEDLNYWTEMKEIEYWNNVEYRIKPDSKVEAKYRPFVNGEECMKEMRKHEPFGLVINKSNDIKYNIKSILIKNDLLYIRGSYVGLVRAFNNYIFADGLPFGVKVEE